MTPRNEDRALRLALQSSDFAAVEVAAREYTRAVAAQAAVLPPAEAAVGLREACKLIEWGRRCACMAQARLREQLYDVRHASAYCTAAGTVHTWGIDG